MSSINWSHGSALTECVSILIKQTVQSFTVRITSLGMELGYFWIIKRLTKINSLKLFILYTSSCNSISWSIPRRRVECESPHFIVRATFFTISRPSHFKMLVLQFFLFNCVFYCRFKTFFKNPATLGHEIWKDLHVIIIGLCFDHLILTYDVIQNVGVKQNLFCLSNGFL